MATAGKKVADDLLNRTFLFAVRTIKLCCYIQEKHKSLKILANQLFRASTSIGANVEEAQGAQSKADFIAKYHIALKEARETHYWLRLLKSMNVVPENRLCDILDECEAIKKILGACLVTGKKNT
jgi:four helix bundle protein